MIAVLFHRLGLSPASGPRHAAGVPVFAAVGGIPEAVPDGMSGIWVTRIVHELTKALRQMYQSP